MSKTFIFKSINKQLTPYRNKGKGKDVRMLFKETKPETSFEVVKSEE
jgi:hypothetical protein